MTDFTGLKYLIVGAGIYGSVMAERIANVLGEKVVVIDKRQHTGGNCHSFIDKETGIEVHQYGSHIFHTKNKAVWEYITQFTVFNTYRHRVFTQYLDKIYPMPIGLQTINQYYGLNLKPYEIEDFIRKEASQADNTQTDNLEGKAISLIGKPLYEAFIKGYTAKQWGIPPNRLPADIITRLPVRYSYNSDYFTDPYQGIPLDGYGSLFSKLLKSTNIEVRKNLDFNEIRNQIPHDCRIIYTGPLDQLFQEKFGPLEWRSLSFSWETLNVPDYQGNSVINYADQDIPYTRIHEFKHYHPERTDVFNSPATIICKEFPMAYSQGMEAYYPINDKTNLERYKLYQNEASKNPMLITGGRLGNYSYWDMDVAVSHALDSFTKNFCPD